MTDKKRLTGTHEWAPITENIYKGKCPNGCLYCYAHSNIARWKKDEAFILDVKKLHSGYKKRNGTIMFPSQHDILPINQDMCLAFLTDILYSGNQIIIVTKPWRSVIEYLSKKLIKYKEQIIWRVTIGAIDNKILKFFEPEASSFEERMECLTILFRDGYQTSVSIEPMLDFKPEDLVNIVTPFVTEKIWLGKCNKWQQRFKMNGHADKIPTANEYLSWQSSDELIIQLVDGLSDNPKVEWKDSIKEVIEKYQGVA